MFWFLFPLLLGRTCREPPLQVKELTPAATVAKSPDLTLIVNGANLSSSSKILWNGNPRPTTYVSDTQLKASIPSSDLVVAGQVVVTVADRKRASPPALMFTINNPPTPADLAASPPSVERTKVVAEASKNAKSRLDKDKKQKQFDDQETPEVSSKLSSDVPKLLSWAEQAMGKGDYAMARSYYQAVLTYDRNNAAANRGLRDPRLQSRTNWLSTIRKFPASMRRSNWLAAKRDFKTAGRLTAPLSMAAESAKPCSNRGA